MSWFAAAGLEPVHVSYCNTVPGVIAHLVEAGAGISIIPTKLIEAQIRANTLVTLACRPSIERAYLCTVHRANETHPALDAGLRAVRQSLADSDLLEPV
jgi:DNA-binding transcriptional LysR family regulator